jgi:hypothetical protein
LRRNSRPAAGPFQRPNIGFRDRDGATLPEQAGSRDFVPKARISRAKTLTKPFS